MSASIATTCPPPPVLGKIPIGSLSLSLVGCSWKDRSPVLGKIPPLTLKNTRLTTIRSTGCWHRYVSMQPRFTCLHGTCWLRPEAVALDFSFRSRVAAEAALCFLFCSTLQSDRLQTRKGIVSNIFLAMDISKPESFSSRESNLFPVL